MRESSMDIVSASFCVFLVHEKVQFLGGISANSTDKFSTTFIIATITFHGAKFAEIDDLEAEIIGRIKVLHDAEILPKIRLFRERFWMQK
jgi:hypothetical protein